MSSQASLGRSQHLGSFLRPQRLAEARSQWKAGTITLDELRSVEDEEILKFVERQRAAGVGCITDGEFRREVPGSSSKALNNRVLHTTNSYSMMASTGISTVWSDCLQPETSFRYVFVVSAVHRIILL
jgi:hypothetical protein